MTRVVAVIGSGGRFAPDPASPGRERWWDGGHWTARVRDADGDEGVHWIPDLVDLPHPGDAPTLPRLPASLPVTAPLLARAATEQPTEALPRESVPAWPALPAPALPTPVAPAPLALPLAGVPDEAPASGPSPSETPEEFRWVTAPAPMGAELDAGPRPPVPETRVPGSRRRRVVMAIGATAAAALIGLAAAAGAGVFTSSVQRPEIEHALAYQDAGAGFALRYPDDWRVLRRDRGSSIRFAIASPGASTRQTNTVSVVVGASVATLPPLHSLADELTEMLREKLPGVRLDTANRTRVADAPGFHFAFRDPDATPATRIEQYVGRTASGRPLTVTVTVREPRTAPSRAEMREFLASLRSGDLNGRS